MAKTRRGRLTISANIVLTASVITRTLSLGFIIMAIYIKVGDDILDADVINIADLQDVAGMPLGTTMKSIVFSLNGIFALELLTGIFGIWGVIGQKKSMLIITVLMSSLMIIIYSIYLVILSILYHEKSCFRETLFNYIQAYSAGSHYISSTYFYNTFPNFLSKLGCEGRGQSGIYYCYDIYNEQLTSYLKTYLGLIVTCCVVQAITIVAVEYTYRKLEFKEKKSSITNNKYYLLLTIQHGIFRNVFNFAKDNWKRSKAVFISVILKIISLIVGAGLLGLGLILIGDEFIHDSSLKYIFSQIQFYNYYFYDILVGLAASSVVIGILTIVIAIFGLVGSWKKSSSVLIMSSVLSIILHVPRIVTVILFVVFVEKINDSMRVQLNLQQQGYFYNNFQSEITRKWNDMILQLKCCGVYSSSDTLSRSNGYADIFCCKNAHESRTDSGWHYYYHYHYYSYYYYYYNHLDFFGGCGGYKTDTCSEKIILKTRQFCGWFLAIVLLQILLEIVGFIFTNKEYSQIRSSDTLDNGIPKDSHNVCNIGTLGLAINVRYDSVFGNSDIEALLSKFRIADHTFTRALNLFSIAVSVGLWSMIIVAKLVEIGLWGKFIASADKELEDLLNTELSNNTYTYQNSQGSGYFNETSLSWNTLFIKAECCGVGSNITNSFTASYWYRYRRDSTSQRIPVQCCKSQTEVHPYAHQYDTDCTHNLLNGYYHSQGCDIVLVDRLDSYSLLFFVFMGINVLAEVGLQFILVL
ncbi:unnamed protein product [Mytilus edulis]|uniref:Tetraspanin n=1 Tax=Mytilus edulis TaxID=6550 RepID=A0A8S3ST89_MYTED|nr:unnamed protein product [Mytilus edulis]